MFHYYHLHHEFCKQGICPCKPVSCKIMWLYWYSFSVQAGDLVLSVLPPHSGPVSPPALQSSRGISWSTCRPAGRKPRISAPSHRNRSFIAAMTSLVLLSLWLFTYSFRSSAGTAHIKWFPSRFESFSSPFLSERKSAIYLLHKIRWGLFEESNVGTYAMRKRKPPHAGSSQLLQRSLTVGK